jgi:DNA-directed RNA polymerase specialized sigma24 family protein
MSRTQTGILMQQLRRLAAEPGVEPASDRELLQRFAAERDENAFALLVRRHGPMVLRVGRRILDNQHDAEDVCQATFLVLAAKAASRFWQASVARWLHRVAYHLARKVGAAAVRRNFHERRGDERNGSKTTHGNAGTQSTEARPEFA